MYRRNFLVAMGAFSLLPSLAYADATTIEKLLNLTKQVLIRLRDSDEYSYDDIADLVDQILHRDRIAKVVAGRKAWIEADDQTRTQFKESLSRYLFDSYVGLLKNYGIAKALQLLDGLEFRETIKGKWAFYKTVLFLKPRVNITVRTTEEKVVDIEAEGISLVITIRDEFKTIIRKGGLTHAIEMMEA